MTTTLEDRTKSAAIRAWAAENGFDVRDRGALPRGIVAAYETATGGRDGDGQDDDDDGEPPDWGGADITTDPDEPEPAGDEPAGDEPPVASLEEARQRIGARNRPPRWARAEPRSKRAPKPPAEPKIKVTTSVRSDVEAKLVLVLGMVAMPWKTADPYCGGAFADDVEKMAKAWTPLLCQSAEVVRFFTRTSTFMLWVAALSSMQNVAGCVYAHHIGMTVEILAGGEVVDKRKDKHGNAGQVIQKPAEDYSLYVVPGHIPPPQQPGNGERVYPSS